MTDNAIHADALLDAMHELIAVVRGSFSDAWLDTKAVAAYLGFSVEVTREEIVCDPSFPKPMRRNGKGHPRWLKSEVAAWARSQQG
jgi:predicted DNA-binding transcriptional regulator AlpA